MVLSSIRDIGPRYRRILSAVAGGVFAVVAGVLSLTPASAHGQTSLSTQTRGWLGIHVSWDSTTGCPTLLSVEPGSPAQIGGLTAGDTIISVNGADVRFKTEKFSNIKLGDRLTFNIRKNGIRSVSLTAGKRPKTDVFVRIEGMSFSKDSSRDTSSSFANQMLGAILQSMFPSVQFTLFSTIISDDKKMEIQPRFVIAGAEMTNLNADFVPELGIKIQGLLVLNVTPKSSAGQSGLKSGDVIIKADSVAVTSVRGLLTRIQKTPERRIVLDIIRQGKLEKCVLRW